ncbi:MAG: nucleotidyltransferase domain-containing protein [Gemmatimonadales bacterium]|nr:nucleotidyltransferase domain-containing protein [Gemmatimonadales bacterium]
MLALLFGHPDQRFFLREIVRAVGAGSGSVQRELAHLVAAGLLTRECHGRQVYFGVNRDAPIYPDLKAIVDKTAGVAEVLRAELAGILASDQAAVAFVFGSVARGQETGASDVDLMIVGTVSLRDVIPPIRLAEARLHREVNPSVFPVSEFRARLKRGSAFLKRVLAEPKVFLKGNDRDLAGLAR